MMFINASTEIEECQQNWQTVGAGVETSFSRQLRRWHVPSYHKVNEDTNIVGTYLSFPPKSSLGVRLYEVSGYDKSIT